MSRPVTPNAEGERARDGSGPAPLTGRFGKYQIERVLGAGGMGTVYLAKDAELGRPVALKVPKFDASASRTDVERFRREAWAAARLTHANVCPVYEVGEADGTMYIAMAYIDGKPLSASVGPSSPMKPRAAALIARKVAIALHAAHEQGIVHRDLKPDNVMIDRRGEPVIMDFGLARLTDGGEANRLTHSGTIVGTPAYMAPEQIGEERDKIGPRTDVYALGVVLFEMLTGRPPFDGSRSALAVLGDVLTKPVPSPRELRPEIPQGLADICVRALAKRPEDRFATMRDMAVALTAFLKSGTTTAVAPPPAQVVASGGTGPHLAMAPFRGTGPYPLPSEARTHDPSPTHPRPQASPNSVSRLAVPAALCIVSAGLAALVILMWPNPPETMQPAASPALAGPQPTEASTPNPQPSPDGRDAGPGGEFRNGPPGRPPWENGPPDPQQLVQRWLQEFDGGNGVRDGRVARDEAPPIYWERHGHADLDGDGALNQEELRAAAEEVPPGAPGPRGPDTGPPFDRGSRSPNGPHDDQPPR